MDCCCHTQQSTFIDDLDRVQTFKNTPTSPKLKYSFRTQQATPCNKQTFTNKFTHQINNPYNTTIKQDPLYGTSSLTQIYNPSQYAQKLHSTVASQNELQQLQRQRQALIKQDRQLDLFYETKIVPLQKEVEFYQHQVKVRNIEIMELQDLLNQRIQQKQYVETINSQQPHMQNATRVPYQNPRHLSNLPRERQSIVSNDNNMNYIVNNNNNIGRSSVLVQQHPLTPVRRSVNRLQSPLSRNIPRVPQQQALILRESILHHHHNKPNSILPTGTVRPQPINQ